MKQQDKLDVKDLSAWLDDECSSQEERQDVLEKLWQDSQMQDTYARFQLIGDAIRGQALSPNKDIVSAVNRQLENEIAHDVPPDLQAAVKKNNQVANAPPNKVLRQHPAIYALVASVFLGVVLVYNPFVSQKNNVNLAANEAVIQSKSQAYGQQPQFGGLANAQLRDLRAMLVAHGQFSTSPGLNGLATYSKLVGEDNNAIY